MANVQAEFQSFHDAIRLDDENTTLREKRDRVIGQLRKGLRRLAEEGVVQSIAFEPFSQGSYAMATGIKPVKGDFDIDVGLRLDVSREEQDPVKVKQWVADALEGHTGRIDVRRPCVTVFYLRNGEPQYHVDLAVYAHSANAREELWLAKGRIGSADERRTWERAEPLELIDRVRTRFDEQDERAQFRRVVRYLKRWKDVHFAFAGHAAPLGIGLTMAAYWLFKPNFAVDSFAGTKRPNDLEAVAALVQDVLSSFSLQLHDGDAALRFTAQVPVQPHDDSFARMTNRQMAEFREKLEKLDAALEAASQEPDPVEACRTLRRQFGEDFPVPDPSKTARKTPPAIVSSSSSA